MNCSWAALAGEAVVSDCGENAGHVGVLLVMPLLPLHGEGDHLDLHVPLLLLGLGLAPHIVPVIIIIAGLVVWVWLSLGLCRAFIITYLVTAPVLLVGHVLHVLLVGALVNGGHSVVGLSFLTIR